MTADLSEEDLQVLECAVRTAAAGGRRRPPKPVGPAGSAARKDGVSASNFGLLAVKHVHTPLHISPKAPFLDRFSPVTRKPLTPGTIPCGFYARWLPLATLFS